MDIQLEKLELIKMLTEIDNSIIIKSIKEILINEKKDWWDDLTNEQKDEIQLGDKQIKNGDFVDFDHFIQKYI